MSADVAALSDLRNVGPAFVRYFAALGVTSVAQLADESADELYLALCDHKGERVDPCAHDLITAAIHQARTGEPRDWWEFSAERKARDDFPEP